MPAKREISLLPEGENVNSFSARLTLWLTTVGRFVIVFTELIVIGAFISRFWLDRQNSDLSESIRQQKAIIESTSQFEKDYNLLQRRLSVIKSFYKDQPKYSDKIASLAVGTPPDILYRNLSLIQDPTSKQTRAQFELIAYNETSLVDYISNLILNPAVSTVGINSIEKKPKDTKYSINISIVFKT